MRVGEDQAQAGGDEEAEQRRLDGDDRRLGEQRQDLEGEGPVPDHRRAARARGRGRRGSRGRHADGQREDSAR